jgi:hypothetical protein
MENHNLPAKSSGAEIQSALLKIVERQDIDPERLEKFLDLQIKMEERQAKTAFVSALATFQGVCPIIVKTKGIKDKGGMIRSKYAPLDEVVYQVKSILVKNGLSYSFDVTKYSEDLQNIVITVSHVGGHSKDFNYPYNPMDEGGSMNNSQRRKSALSYAKRAAFENAFGIVTQGDDDEAQRLIDTPISEESISEIKDLIEKTDSDFAAVLKFLKVDRLEDLSALEAKKAVHALKQKRSK